MAMSLADFMSDAKKAGAETAFETFKEFVETSTSRIGPNVVWTILKRVPDFLKEIPPGQITLAIDFVAFMLEGIVPRFTGANHFYRQLALFAVRGVRSLASGSIIGFTEAVEKARAQGKPLSTEEFSSFLEKTLDVPIEVIKNPPKPTPGQRNYIAFAGRMIEVRKLGLIMTVSTDTFWKVEHLFESGAIYVQDVIDSVPEMTEDELKSRLKTIKDFFASFAKMKEAYKTRRRLSSTKDPAAVAAREAQRRGDNPLTGPELTLYEDRRKAVEGYMDDIQVVLTALQVQSATLSWRTKAFVIVSGTVTDRLLNAGGGERLADGLDFVWDTIFSWKSFWVAVALFVLFLLAFGGSLVLVGLPFGLALLGTFIEGAGAFIGVLYLLGYEILSVKSTFLVMFLGIGMVALTRYLLWPGVSLAGEIFRNTAIENKWYPVTIAATWDKFRRILTGRFSEADPNTESTDEFVDRRLKNIPWRDPQWLLKPISGLFIACVFLLMGTVSALSIASLFEADSIFRTIIGIILLGVAGGGIIYFEFWYRSTRYKSVEQLGKETKRLEKSTRILGTRLFKWAVIPSLAVITLIGTAFQFAPKSLFYSCPTADAMLALSQEELELAIPNREHREYCVDARIRPLLTR